MGGWANDTVSKCNSHQKEMFTSQAIEIIGKYFPDTFYLRE